MPKITTVSKNFSVPEQSFGSFQTIPVGEVPRTGIVIHSIQSSDLTSSDGCRLTPIAIGQRLWSAFKAVDKKLLSHGSRTGTTASVTVIDESHFITATVGNILTFAAFYDLDGKILGVVRLNSESHTPQNNNERARIVHSGGKASQTKIDANLEVTRALGNQHESISSNAKIDIHFIPTLTAQAGVTSPIGKIQFISTSIDLVQRLDKDRQEHYLTSILHKISLPGALEENNLARLIINKAKSPSKHNTVSVQSIPNTSVFIGMFSALSTPQTAAYVINRVGAWFKYYCELSLDAYVENDCSVHSLAHDYTADNAQYVEPFRVTDDVVYENNESFEDSSGSYSSVLAQLLDQIRQEDDEYERFIAAQRVEDDSASSTSSTATPATISPAELVSHKRKRSPSPNFFTEETDDNDSDVAPTTQADHSA